VFSSIDELGDGLRLAGYIADRVTISTVYLAARLQKPLLLEGPAGSGKTTLLKNIITQDLFRTVGTSSDSHRIPMLIFDGKGDQGFLSDLLPAKDIIGYLATHCGRHTTLRGAHPNGRLKFEKLLCGTPRIAW
jgi:ATPase subunit of ABC transporter with duplicated ATPase domains